MRAVADASSLIHVAKVPAFWALLRRTFEEILIPEAVHKEILKGREIQSPDVPVIEDVVSEGWLKVEKVGSMPGLPENLGEEEREAIALMEEVDAEWLLIDDRVTSTTARLRRLPVGYYLSSRDYLAIRKLLR